MDRLGAMEIFIRLSELGSFTAVAEEANLSKSKISKEISKLEEYVGARLLHRSTRHLQLTSLGMIYLKRCKSILREVEEAHSDIQLIQKRPAGKLKISLPMALGLTELSPIFTEFMRLYPHIETRSFFK
ncbi:LysR family transcriptional regulator [Pseudoalteromonas xiamenensis]|uniref:LysR family transcriptional regulator n=1 Tax=Pseudoalteromonas xiamenensis TaxID=882626 RepID=UPI001FCA5CEC|nr:LysR family transcriptional regulator [Pseudoalteromonas xiamenensis]